MSKIIPSYFLKIEDEELNTLRKNLFNDYTVPQIIRG